MKTRFVFLSCALALAIAPGAIADDLVNLHNRPLEKTQYFHYRPMFGIEETAPIVSDWRRASQQTTYQIVIPPVQTPSNQVQVLVVPPTGDCLPGLVAQRPLAPAGFSSNINPTKSRANSLPKGDTVGQHVIGNLLGASRPTSPTIVRDAQKPQVMRTPQGVLSYQKPQPSAFGSEEIKTASRVRADLLRK